MGLGTVIGAVAAVRTGPTDAARPGAAVAGYQVALLVAAGIALPGGPLVTCPKTAPDEPAPSPEELSTGPGHAADPIRLP